MRVIRAALSCAVLGFAAARGAEWKPETDGVSELNGVEEALKRVQGAALDGRQRKAAAAVVQDVNHVLAVVRGGSNLTKAEKKAQVKIAIEKLQALQSQWEMAAVETSMQALLNKPMSPSSLQEARVVAVAVNSIVDEIESGKLTGTEQHKKAGEAIQKLQVLEEHLRAASSVSNVSDIQHKLAEKKALLAREEKELQLAKLQKELLEKKAELANVEAEQREAQQRRKLQQEDAAQEAQIAKMVSFAKELVAAKGLVAKKVTHTHNSSVSQAANASSTPSGSKALPPQLAGILVDLSARAQSVSAAIARMDANDKIAEADLERRANLAAAAPVTSQKDPLARGAAILKMVVKRQHRNFLKARALKVMELKELTDGIQKIKAGDVQGLKALESKMEGESKNMQAKGKGFLHGALRLHKALESQMEGESKNMQAKGKGFLH